MSLNTHSIFVWILIIIFYHVLYTRMDMETCTRRLYKNVPWKVYSSRLQEWTVRDVYYRPMYKDGAGDNTSCIQGWTWRRVHVLNTMMNLETCSRPVYMASLGNFYSSCIQGWTWRRALVLYTRIVLETCTRPVYKDSPGEVYSFCIQGWTWRRLLVLYTRMDLKTCTRPVYKDWPGDVYLFCMQCGPGDLYSHQHPSLHPDTLSFLGYH